MEYQPLAPLKKGEIIGGFVYLPMYLIGTQLLVTIAVTINLLLQQPGQALALDESALLFQVNLWYNLVNLLTVGTIFCRFLWGQRRSFRISAGRVIGAIAIGYAIIFAGNILISLTEGLLSSTPDEIVNGNQELAERMVLDNPLLGAVMVVLCAPIVEECLFRGLIFGLIHRKSRVLAYAVSMTAFSAMHVYQYALLGQPLLSTVVSFLTYLPMGFALAWVFDRCRSIWASIALHIFNNAVALGLILLMQQLSALAQQLGV